MTKRRAIVLAILWGVTLLAVCGWVTSRTDQEVSFGDGLLLGAVAATVLAAMAARVGRG